MSISYEISPEARVIRVVARGETTSNDWRKVYTDIRKDIGDRASMNMIIDVREHKSVIETKQVFEITNKIEAQPDALRWAIVGSRTVSMGMANMFSTLTSEKNISVRFFSNMDEAESWVS